MTEESVVAVFNDVLKRISSKFKYSFNSKEDIQQNGMIHCIQAMDRYEPGRPLENFLMVNLHNRFCNDLRNNSHRIDTPCQTCPLFNVQDKRLNDQCEEFEQKESCVSYSLFMARNEAKRNVLNMIDISDVLHDDSHRVEKNMVIEEKEDIGHAREVIEVIERDLPVENREAWIRLKEGLKLPKNKRDKLLEIIREIVQQLDWADSPL